MRREQVLRAAVICFAEQGFHVTTMADVIRASGLSAGAVYRYFPSKNALVLTAASGAVGHARHVLADALDSPEPLPPDEVVARLLRDVLAYATQGGVDLTRVAVSAWAEALRDPELAVEVRGFYSAIRADLVRVAERWRDAGGLSDDTDTAALGQVLLSTVAGFLVQRLLLGDLDVDSYAAGLRTLSGRGTPAPGAAAPGTATTR
jgi:AcrR family transcriptional regulator